MGFSAGGELAFRAAQKFDDGDPNATDPVDKLGCKPAFQALIYPGTSNLIQPVEDRAGHDDRYALDAAKLHSLGWAPTRDLDRLIVETVDWYRQNESWWRPLRSGDFQRYYERQYGARLASTNSMIPNPPTPFPRREGGVLSSDG